MRGRFYLIFSYWLVDVSPHFPRDGEAKTEKRAISAETFEEAHAQAIAEWKKIQSDVRRNKSAYHFDKGNFPPHPRLVYEEDL